MVTPALKQTAALRKNLTNLGPPVLGLGLLSGGLSQSFLSISGSALQANNAMESMSSSLSELGRPLAGALDGVQDWMRGLPGWAQSLGGLGVKAAGAATAFKLLGGNIRGLPKGLPKGLTGAAGRLPSAATLGAAGLAGGAVIGGAFAGGAISNIIDPEVDRKTDRGFDMLREQIERAPIPGADKLVSGIQGLIGAFGFGGGGTGQIARNAAAAVTGGGVSTTAGNVQQTQRVSIITDTSGMSDAQIRQRANASLAAG